jgi:2',3'-cyclic-nucleotide 2'-phosphodiesterase (5'-nucleotidase family)
MPKMRFIYLFPLLIFIGVTHYSFSQTAIIDFDDYKIDSQTKVDSSIIRMLMPYKDSIQHSMSTVIGFSLKGLTKKQPESALGNFMADGMKFMAEKKINKKIDVAFVNYGGIRSYLPKGDITVGMIYELMPFDNLIVLQEVKGSVLQQYLDKIAARDGWPVSGIQMGIKDKKAVNIFIGNQPFSKNTTYLVANSDYIANGGDDCEMLRGIDQININYLFRDALIEYVLVMTRQGKSIDITTENRIVYAN